MKRLKPIRQQDPSDCAVACIAFTARMFGLSLPMITIRQACGATQEGTTIKGVMDGCACIGLEAEPFKSPSRNISVLKDIPTPAILHITNEDGYLHFVVFCGMDGGDAKIMDPAKGKVTKVPLPVLAESWNGYLILVKPGKGFVPGDRTRSLWQRLAPTIVLFRKEIFSTAAMSALFIATGVSFSLVLQQFIDTVLPSSDIRAVMKMAAVMVLLILTALVSGFLRTKRQLQAATGIDYKMTSDYITHLFRLPVAFFAQRGVGEINSRIGDVYKVRNFITEGVSSLTISIVTLAVSFALMFSFHWKLALLTLSFLLFYSGIFIVASKTNVRWSREIIGAASRLEETCVGNIAAVKTLKYCNCEDAGAAAARQRSASLCSNVYRGGMAAGKYALAADNISKWMLAALLSVGAIAVFGGSLTIGELVSFYTLSSFCAAPLGSMVELSAMLADTRIAAERLFDVMELGEEPRGGYPLECESPGVIEFEGVSFGYPGGREIITDFNATLQSGEIVVVSGPSGSGKSSLASLLTRVYEPSGGRITLNGIDIGAYCLRGWRNYVAIVPQEIILTDDTIIYNITRSEEIFDSELVGTLLRKLGMESFIKSLPKGLLTKVGEGGRLLSGGQRQKIGIVAALYRRPKLLILDEATNSLDAESEQKVLDTLIELKKESKTTILLITHKRDNMKMADHIIRMTPEADTPDIAQSDIT
ncbi:MAG: peptidase domain-containing ABC transporter [Bacteroidales bacterium]|nr:peptidase domain-containing ABC transporter [Bacteroidales bacterium]